MKEYEANKGTLRLYEEAYNNLINGNRADWRGAIMRMGRLEVLGFIKWIEENTGKGAIWAINNIMASIRYEMEIIRRR